MVFSFPRNYPASPPDVGFSTPFRYHNGASYIINDDTSPLYQCQVICLNILGNFASFHGEWASAQGEGWSSAMGVSNLMIQLQTTLLELDSSCGDAEKRRIKSHADNLKVDVSREEQHMGLCPYPEVHEEWENTEVSDSSRPSSEDGDVAPGEAKAEMEKRHCYFTLNTYKDDIMGFGVDVAGKSIKTDGELLSLEAYEEHAIRLTAYKKPFTDFIPAFICPEHAEQPKWYAKFKEYTDFILLMTPDVSPYQVLCRLMTTMTVETMKGEKHAALSFFEAYCSFWRSLRYLLTKKDVEGGKKMTQKIKDFVYKERCRGKDVTPDVGILLALYTVLPESCPRQDFIDAYLDESMIRQVLWWQKGNVPLNGALLRANLITEATFKASEVSRELLMFNLRMLDIVIPNGDADVAAAGMDRTLGQVADRFDALKAQQQEEPAIRNWAEFYAQTPASAEEKKRVADSELGYVSSLVARAHKRGSAYVWTAPAYNNKGKGKGKGKGFRR